MVLPLLKLTVLQGPRKGDSLVYNPGSTVRIGRYVRGNEICIKDAGISTKHLRIVSDSENWIIHDLGSSNGTILNSDTLDPDTPVNLRHGDLIKLGEDTSIVVNFETDVQAQEQEDKVPARTRRSNRRLPVPDPDPVPMESVQEKPTRKGRSAKQDGDEPPRRRGRPPKRKTLKDIAESENESDVENDKEVISRVTRSRKKVAITKEEEEVPVEKKGNSRARGGKKNTEAAQNSGSNSIKLEMEELEISAVNKRAIRSRQIGNECLGLEENIKSEDTAALQEKRPTRVTRSKMKEIGGDETFRKLEPVVLNQPPKSRAKKKKMETKSVVEEIEDRNGDVDEDKENGKDVETKSVVEEIEDRNEDVDVDKENGKDVETQKIPGDEEDETLLSKSVEQVETELKNSTLGEEDLNSSVREDGETENLQDTTEEEKECESDVAGIETSDGGCECDEEKAEQESRNKKNVEKIDLEKMTLGEWFEFMRVQLHKQIMEETEEMIEAMRIKSLRVHKYIEEQKQAKRKGSAS